MLLIAAPRVRIPLSPPNKETFEKCSILFKFKEGENFNHRNTYSILRIKLKLHCVQNVEPDTEIGQKGAFCKGHVKNSGQSAPAIICPLEGGQVLRSFKSA